MKNTWRILGAVAALTLGACTGGGDGGEGGNGAGTGSCMGTFSGAVTGNVGSCSITAVKIPSTGQLQFTIKFKPASGLPIPSDKDISTIVTVLGDAKAATYSGADIKEGLGTIYTTDNKAYELQITSAGTRYGSATLTIDSVPTGTPVGERTNYAGFGGNAQLKFSTTNATGDINLALTFTRP
jgi:hypothetical protein